jgi:hypothetical protein
MKYDLERLRSKVKAAAATKTVVKDSEGYFQPYTDESGVGSAILRFLPPLDEEEFPFVELYNHAFKAPSGKWFIENCPTTLTQPCPVCEANSSLWNGRDRALASLRKPKMYYVSNILVVGDPKRSENEGKVFLYKYGVTIMGKMNDAITPPFADTEAIDPFDPEEGANFNLRIVRSGGFPNYDESRFDVPSRIDPNIVESVLEHRRSLAAIVDPRQFKSYDDLKNKFDQMVGLAKTA